MALNILLVGARGRMGQAISKAAVDCDAVILAACDQGDSPEKHIAECDVIIDFSFHEVTPVLAELAAKHGKPMVIGATGHTAEERATVLAAAEKIPMVWAGNFSIGVNVLFHLVGKAAKLLSSEYEPEIIEMHHHSKIDAPSGTAERLIEQVLENRGLTRENVQHGREGNIGARPQNEVGVHAVRGGSIVGDHEVLFAGPFERISLSHHAEDRGIFARGAIRAGHWVLGQTPGVYNMEDVLGLRD
ncbi:4-hydroxy-tetrahydrodipicolinate reductase [Cerasicoccus fimbriatus]|uniref:4-hydroxy-tetrahydrodipicolinate reductase n=1 Tax=Cerasicoccus fimbriatus TaxID=3014554 RepID=UPI0022B38D76|nr:4-hydroxy-tetrahydrodipicolinate reductase [Cerasicoccus sp. TK19100]